MVLNVTYHAFFIGPGQDRHHGTYGTGWLWFPEVLLGNFVFKNSRLVVLLLAEVCSLFARVLCFRVLSQTQGFMQNIIPLVINVIKFDFLKISFLQFS